MNLTINRSLSQVRLICIHLIILIPLTIFIAFYNLDAGASFGTGTGIDESWYIQVSQEMKQTGQWWLPTREGIPFFYKPPLKFWITALSSSIFGEDIKAYRGVDATIGVALLALTYTVACLTFNSLNAGFFAALSLIACYGFLFANGIRFATLDTLVLFFSSNALLLLKWSSDRAAELTKKQQIYLGCLTGLLIGLTVLTKSVLGYYVFGVYGAWFLIGGNWITRLKQSQWYFTSLLALSVFIPLCWFLPHALITEGAWSRMFGYELVGRFGKGFHNTYDRSYYWKAFLAGRYLPFYTTMAAVLFFAFYSLQRKNRDVAFFVIWTVLPFVIFTFLSSRLLWYVAPCYIPAAILNGGFVSLLIDEVAAVLLMESFSIQTLKQPLLSACALLVLIVAVFESGYYVSANVTRVAKGSPRMAIDEVVQDLLTFRKPALNVVYSGAPEMATRERIFTNMLGPKPGNLSAEAVPEAIQQSTAYAVISDFDQGMQLVKKIPFQAYRYLPPFDYPQGPEAIARPEGALILAGSQDSNSLRKLSHFKPRKTVLKLSADRRQCHATGQDAAQGSKTPPKLSLNSSINCQFEGDRLLNSAPTRLALSIGQVLEKDSPPLALEISINHTRLAILDPFRSRLENYSFNLPAGTWFEGDNSVHLSLLNNNPGSDYQRSHVANRLLVNWLVIDFAPESDTEATKSAMGVKKIDHTSRHSG